MDKVALLFLGLILSLININIMNLATYTTWIGDICVFLALWKFRNENREIRIAYWFALVRLCFKALGYWNSLLPPYSLENVAYVVTGIALVLSIVQFKYMFDGLALIALRFGDEILARKYKMSFALYFIMSLLIAMCLGAPILAYIALPFAVISIIYILSSVYKLDAHFGQGKIDKETDVTEIPEAPETSESAEMPEKSKWLAYKILAIYLVIAVAGCFGILHFANAPKVEAVPYQLKLSAESETIKDTLISMGAEADILNDLPEEELQQYKEVKSLCSDYEVFNIDGGKLTLTYMAALLPDYKVRVSQHYRWDTPPKHGYIDTVSLAGDIKEYFTLDVEPKAKGISLFDSKGAVYRQKAQNENDWIGQFNGANEASAFNNFFGTPNFNGRTIQIQYRAYPKLENQRGYIAYNAVIIGPEEMPILSVYTTYVHQGSIWNVPFVDVRGQAASYGYHRIKTKAFASEAFYRSIEYYPEGVLKNVK